MRRLIEKSNFLPRIKAGNLQCRRRYSKIILYSFVLLLTGCDAFEMDGGGVVNESSVHHRK